MQDYEYRAIPAPARSEKVKGAKTPADRYAVTLTDSINEMAKDGWEYLRAETLPSEERSGLTGRTTVFHNLLIFRRATQAAARQEPARPVVQHSPVTPPAATPEANPQPERQQAAQAPAGSPVFSEKMRVNEKVEPAPPATRKEPAKTGQDG